MIAKLMKRVTRCSPLNPVRPRYSGMAHCPAIGILLLAIWALGGSKSHALSFSAPSVVPVGTGDVSVAVGDVDGDGRVDLVSASSSSFRILIGNGNGTFQSPIIRGTLVSFINNNALVKLVDVNDDQNLDVLIFSGGFEGVIPNVSGLINVFLGNGDGTFQTSIETMISVAGFPMGFVVADFDGDDFPEVVVSDRILKGNGDGTFQTATAFAGGGAHVLTGDFNGDQIPDLVGLYPKNGSSLVAELRYSKGNGNGTFDGAVAFTLAGGFLERDTCALTGDFNKDGKVDVAYSYTSGAIDGKGYRVLLGTGTGSFQSPILTTTLTPYGVVQFCAGDFDGDGRTDVLPGNQANSMPIGGNGYFSNGFLDQTQPLTAFRSSGNGGFSSRGTVAMARISHVRMVTADLNRDGRPDLALVGSVSGSASVYTLLNTTMPNPAVTVTGKKILSTSRGTITIKGHATDTKGELARVEVKAGRAAYAPVNGTSTWKYPARLRSHKSTFLFRAVDVSGVLSRVAKVTVLRP